MRNRVEDWLTHIDNPGDLPYLKTKLLDVNIRLFRDNTMYSALVRAACDHIKTAALLDLEGYKLPHGMSGANVGIPWNIIAIVRNRGSHDTYADVMINPLICKYSLSEEEAISNCGSIRLKEPIRVKRSVSVVVKFFDLQGNDRKECFGRDHGAFTIQHEVDHNNGILITDREIK